MPKAEKMPGAVPWQAKARQEMQSRPGVCFVQLLTDEDGCALIAQGILPEDIQEQARRAMEWLCTDTRGFVKASSR